MKSARNTTISHGKILSGIMFTVLLFLSVVVVYWPSEPKPITLGFVGNLTGPLSDWGINSRDGFLLSIERLNANGGIRNRPIALIIRDDKLDPRLGVKAVDELIDAGVVAIIGPTASAAAEAMVNEVNARRMLLLAPSASTTALSGIDDLFLRVPPANDAYSVLLANLVVEQRGWKRVRATYSLINRAYFENAFDIFQQRVEELGGQVEVGDLITSAPDYDAVTRSLASEAADGIYIGGEAVDIGTICQKLRALGIHAPIASEGSASLEEILQYGGEAVEGLIMAPAFFDDEQNAAYQEFKATYQERFGKEPHYSVVFGYDAATVITEALRQSREWTPEALKQAILTIGVFPSPAGAFQIDRYGDAIRPAYPIIVEGGRFIPIR